MMRVPHLLLCAVLAGLFTVLNTQSNDMTVCERLLEATNNIPLCSVYSTGQCIGEIEDGRLCDCPPGKYGALCQHNGASATTKCKRQKVLHDYVIKLLNVSYSDINIDLLRTVIKVPKLIQALKEIGYPYLYQRECDDNVFDRVQCEVNLYMNMTQCYCADTQTGEPIPGREKTSYKPTLSSCMSAVTTETPPPTTTEVYTTRTTETTTSFGHVGSAQKAGVCPNMTGMTGACAEFCTSDESCSDNQKCCSNGCGRSCVTPDLSDVCTLDVYPAGLLIQCLAAIPSWFYNRNTSRCERFVYGGCASTGNLFDTVEHCYERCNKSSSPCKKDTCSSGQLCKITSDQNCPEGYCQQSYTCIDFVPSQRPPLNVSMPWMPEYGRKSPQQWSLQRNVTSALTQVYGNIPNFLEVNITGIFPGSVIVSYDVLFTTEPNSYHLQQMTGVEQNMWASGMMISNYNYTVKEATQKGGICPNVTGFSGICAEECRTDFNCTGSQKCCSNGCGHVCRVPAASPKQGYCPRPGPTEGCIDHMDTCSQDADCAGVSKCCVKNCDRQCVSPEPYPPTPPGPPQRPGACPNMTGMVGACVEACDMDSDCGENDKCCSNGCGHTCMAPDVSDVCTLDTYPPGLMIRCEAWMPTWFYNRTTSRCEMFVYGGCGSTGNKFDSADSCYERCNMYTSPCKDSDCGPGQICQVTSNTSCYDGYCQQREICTDVVISHRPPISAAMTWMPDYGRIGSLQQKILRHNITSALKMKYWNMPNFIRVNVTGIFPGSVVVTYDVVFNTAVATDYMQRMMGIEQDMRINGLNINGDISALTQVSEKGGLCPNMTGFSGICVEGCRTDFNCTGSQKCCHNGCGHVCMAPASLQPNRTTTQVPYFTTTTSGQQGMCPNMTGMAGTCVELCTSDLFCAPGQKCCSNGCGKTCMNPVSYTSTTPPLPTTTTVLPTDKPGLCPSTAGMVGVCAQLCGSDNFCPEDQKCCSNGCGSSCMAPVPEICGKGKKEPGLLASCFGYFPNWFYNSNTSTCEFFIYGGCGSTGNKFNSAKKCYDTCNSYASPCATVRCGYGQVCAISKREDCFEGDCANVTCANIYPLPRTIRLNMNWMEAYWNLWSSESITLRDNLRMALVKKFDNLPNFHDVNITALRSGSVIVDYDIQLTANLDNYGQEQLNGIDQEIEATGVSVGGRNYSVIPDPGNDICQLPLVIGMCRAMISRWFYNSTSRRCDKFHYGGCGGNDNNFDTVQQCYDSCGISPCATALCAMGTQCAVEANPSCRHGNCSHTAVCRNDACTSDPETGPCRGSMSMWFYNTNTSRCEKFTYGGCLGNENRFHTPSQCYNSCNFMANPCYGKSCANNQSCGLAYNTSCELGACYHDVECRPFRKPGTCPSEMMQVSSSGECSEQCKGDNDCIGDKKCCYIGCNKQCFTPGDVVSSCGEGRWMCPGVKKCIANVSRCDGYDDCGDMSDEMNCTKPMMPCTNILLQQQTAFTDVISTCFQVVAALNTSQISSDDVCRFLNSSLGCAKHVMARHGVGCTYSDIHTQLVAYVGMSANYPDISNCTVPTDNETMTPICKDSYLIAVMVSNSICVSSTSMLPSSVMCSRLSSIVSCAKMYIHCPASNLTNGLIDQAPLLLSNNNLDIAGCPRPTGMIYEIKETARIDMPWTSDLYQPSSYMYKKLARALEVTLTRIYTYVGGLEGVRIEGFGKGSVIFNYTVQFTMPVAGKEAQLTQIKSQIESSTITVNQNTYKFLPPRVEKAGYCPNVTRMNTTCMTTPMPCSSDSDCPGYTKCCPGYCGQSCRAPVNTTSAVCVYSSDCLNGGTCRNSYCYCARGYNGSYCQNEIDPCASSPCQNNGSCYQSYYPRDNYTCSCPTGTYGDHCQYFVCDMFRSDMCQGSGSTCVGDFSSGQLCECSIDRSGLFCEKIEYAFIYGCEEQKQLSLYLEEVMNGAPAPFNYNVVSSLSDVMRRIGQTSFVIPTCDAENPAQYTSPSCMIDMDTRRKECYCVDKYGYQMGYQRVNESQLPLDCKGPCDNNPCQNGGTCSRNYYYSYEMNGTNPYTCMCPEGIMGEHCEKSFCDMLPLDPCAEYGGRCSLNFTNGQLCDCSSTYTPMSGILCDVPGVANTTDCQRLHNLTVVAERFLNGSLTLPGVSDTGGMLRRLFNDFHMVRIQRPLCNEYGIAEKACFHYVDNMTMTKCFCLNSYGGKLMNTPYTINTPPEYCPAQGETCYDSTCINNSTCFTTDDRSFCKCMNGYQGQYCQNYVGSICDQNPCLNGFACSEYVYNAGDYYCNCSYAWGTNCGKVPIEYCDCPASQRCAYHEECDTASCSLRRKCVGYDYSSQCDAVTCNNHGVCVEQGTYNHYCKCRDGYSGPNCYTRNAVCDMLGGANICGNGKCVGNIAEGELCQCPTGLKGAFCEQPGTVGTTCQKQSDLYNAAIQILNGSLTIPGIENATRLVEFITTNVMKTREITLVNCTAGGGFAPQQCAVDIYTMDKRCYCVNSIGIEIFQNVTMLPGQAPCTSPDPTDLTELMCLPPTGDFLCQNGGSCRGEMDNTPLLCECAPGYEGILCERMSEPGESPPEEYSMCTFMLDSYRMTRALMNGNLSLNLFGITMDRETMLWSMNQGMAQGIGVGGLPVTIPGMPDNMVEISNATGTLEMFTVVPNCTESGQFAPLQCEYGLVSGEQGPCFCYSPEGKVVHGTRTMPPSYPDCTNITSSCEEPMCPFNCTHGYRKNILGCEICECKEVCEGRMCPHGHRCVERFTGPQCVETHKRGMCPLNAMADMESLMRMFEDTQHSCDMECQDDASCRDNLKCCGACGNKCVEPFFPQNCIEKRELMQAHWYFYHNVSEALTDQDTMMMANQTFPSVLQSAISWVQSTTKMWWPMCNSDGGFTRVQCEHDMQTSEKVNCFCADDKGHRINGTDTLSEMEPTCEKKPGFCAVPMSDVMSDECQLQCEDDYGCQGHDKCCASGCSTMCRRPVNDTISQNTREVAAIFRRACEMFASLNFCQYGSQCVGDWMTGDLCRCPEGYRGPLCDIRMAPEEQAPTVCEKKRGVYDLIMDPDNIAIKTQLIAMADLETMPVMKAECTEEGQFEPVQCDYDIVNSGMEMMCYCVQENGEPIPGTTTYSGEQRPFCGAPTCAIGGPLYSNASDDTVTCGSNRRCPPGYQCKDLAHGKAVCCIGPQGHDNSCKLAPNPGIACEGSDGVREVRYYYNQTLERCVSFTYRGCGGNNNSYPSEDACQARCGSEVTDKPGQCPPMPANAEQCRYQDNDCANDMSCPEDKKCCQTGCGRKCRMPGNETVDICDQPKQPGPCKAAIGRYFFNKQKSKCEKFMYGGCQANDNNFETLEDCCQHCGSGEDACKPGECPVPTTNYLVTCADKCESDSDCQGNTRCCYNGCGRECLRPPMNVTMNCHTKLREARVKLNNHKPDMGCPVISLPRCNEDGTWRKQQCLDGFGVCWCVNATGDKIPGTLVRGFANCDEVPPVPEYLANTTSMQTDSEWKYFQMCPADSGINCCSPTLCQMHTCPGNPSAVCRVNPCNGCKVEFYDHMNRPVRCTDDLSSCESQHHRAKTARLQHAYNRMPSPMYANFTQALMELKMPRAPEPVNIPEKCQLLPVTGNCRAYKPKWFYNHETNRCEMFIWGGCGGNDNKFETVEECYSECQPRANPCELHDCGRDMVCALEVDWNCDQGKCSHWPICRYGDGDEDPHVTGVDMPSCESSGDYSLMQCHHDYCWCVDREYGRPVQSSLTVKYNLVCNYDGSFQILDKTKKVLCDEGATPDLSCLNTCLDKVCPLSPNASCVVSLCDTTCQHTFMEDGAEVSCGDDMCDVYFAQPQGECPDEPAACSGPGSPRVCTDLCQNRTCSSNPCAVCVQDSCSCEVEFVDMLTKQNITDCDTITHSMCEMDTCRQSKAKMHEMGLYGESSIHVPSCTAGGHYEPLQCAKDGFCWCVNGGGQWIKAASPDGTCAWNETITVVVIMKFNEDFDKVKGKIDIFSRALEDSIQRLTGIPDSNRYIMDIEVYAGSVMVKLTLEDPDNTGVPSTEVPLMGDMIQNRIKNGEMEIEYEGETWTADQGTYERFDRYEQVGQPVVDPTTPPVPVPEPTLKTHEIIIIAVVSAAVGIALLCVLVKCCCCRNKSKKEENLAYSSNEYMSYEKSMQPTLAVSNASYGVIKHPMDNKAYEADPDFIKVRL